MDRDTHLRYFFTARRSAERGYAIVSRPSVRLRCLSLTLPVYSDRNTVTFNFFEHNYTCISLRSSQPSGKEAPICY